MAQICYKNLKLFFDIFYVPTFLFVLLFFSVFQLESVFENEGKKKKKLNMS